MAIRSVVTRGYGPGATIPLVVLRGYIVGPEIVLPNKKVHTVDFSAESASVEFDTVEQRILFSTAGISVTMITIDDPIVTELVTLEDGFNILLENGEEIELER